MSRVRPYVRRHYIGLLALFVALGGTSFAAVKSIVGRDGVIHGCYVRKSGSLRVVSPGRQCRHNESAVAWSRDGRPGVPGIAGPQGPTGAAGVDGQPGAQTGHATLPAGPTLAGSTSVAIDLASPGGSGKIVLTRPSRIQMSASVDFSKPAGQNGLEESVGCRLKLDSGDGSGFQKVGFPADTTLTKSGFQVLGHSSPTASADVPAGTYNVQLACARTPDSSDSASTASIRGGDLNVVAVVR